jgi:hypothetical protein
MGGDGSQALWGARAALIVLGLAGWFWSQRLIGQRAWPVGGIGDGIHQWTERQNRWLRAHPGAANGLLIATSALIDALGLSLLASAVFGSSFRPFLGLLLLFVLRQACQGLCALPPPEGMIWRHPGFPSLLVTYGTATDLFFSGHTAIAVYGGIELARLGGVWVWVGIAVSAIEATTVLVLRAHYTMDVFAAIFTALWAAAAAGLLAPYFDRALAGLLGAFAGG